MLAQLGTDSGPESGKINLNYSNAAVYLDNNGIVTNVVIVQNAETNLNAWTPTNFFLAAAQTMFAQLNLRDATNGLITVSYIPLWPTNYYTPAVHRVLQLAANIYDATTNGPYPTIFRPYFTATGSGTNNSIIISGYELVNGPSDTTTDPSFTTPLPVDLNDQTVRAAIGTQTRRNVSGVPWIIGAKKGFPNLNEVVVQSVSQITRKLKIHRTTIDESLTGHQTRQMLEIGISNVVGVEVWNSYRTNYQSPSGRSIYVQADAALFMTLTNDIGIAPTILSIPTLGGANLGTNMGAITLNPWPGTGLSPGSTVQPNVQSFQVPLLTNVIFLPDSVFQQTPFGLSQVSSNAPECWTCITPNYFPMPHWGLTITNRIRCMIIDGGVGGRVVDYVQLNGLNTYRDLSGEIYTYEY